MDAVCWVALESTDFRYKSTKNHPKALILQGFYGSGRRSRKFESCHLDHRSKNERHRLSFFALIVGIQIRIGLRSKRKFEYERSEYLREGEYLVSPFGECCTSTISSVHNKSDEHSHFFYIQKGLLTIAYAIIKSSFCSASTAFFFILFKRYF